METRELIARLEATQDQADELTRRLIDDLKEHAAARDAVDRMELWRMEQRGAAVCLIMEAQSAMVAAKRISGFRRLLGAAVGVSQ